MSAEIANEQPESIRQALLDTAGSFCETEQCDTRTEEMSVPGITPDGQMQPFVLKSWRMNDDPLSQHLQVSSILLDPRALAQGTYAPLSAEFRIFDPEYNESEFLSIPHWLGESALDNDAYAKHFLDTFQNFLAVHPHRLCMNALLQPSPRTTAQTAATL